MKIKILIILFSYFVISCSNNKKQLEVLIDEDNKELTTFYKTHFYKEYNVIEELLREKDTIAFKEFRRIEKNISSFDNKFSSLSKPEKLSFINSERKKLINLNPKLIFLNINLIKDFDEPTFNSSLKKDLFKSYYNSILKFKSEKKYNEIIYCGININETSK